MQLFYTPDLTTDKDSYTFDKEESRHIVKALRKKGGDNIFSTNGLGYLFQMEITLASDSKCTVSVLSTEIQKAPRYRLHLAVAPTKMNERFEWLLEKATEIGVSEITPIICDHSERTTLKSDRMEKIILSAMKQSASCFLPKLNASVSFKTFVKSIGPGQNLIAHCLDADKKSIRNVIEPAKDVTILIGPEGDFSENEVKSALANGCIPISLGGKRLRTETAAIVACHSIAFINE